MKIPSIFGQIFEELPRLKHAKSHNHEYHNCPTNAADENRADKDGELFFLIQMLRKLHKASRIFVYDSNLRLFLGDSCISGFAKNDDSVQLSLNVDWLSAFRACSGNYPSTPVCSICPAGTCICEDPVMFGVVDQLRRLHAAYRLIVWEPISARLLSGPAIELFYTAAGSIYIRLAMNWPQLFDADLRAEK